MENLLLFLSTVRPKIVVNKQSYLLIGQKRDLQPSLLDRYLVGRFYLMLFFLIALFNVSTVFGQATYNATLPCQTSNATAAALTKGTVTYAASTIRTVSGGANTVLTEAWKVKADVNGQVGFFHGIRVTYPILNTTCLDQSSNSRQFALYDYAGNVCSGSSISPYFVNDGITNAQTGGAEVNTMNPAWTGLTPNGDYVVIVRTTVGSSCTGITNTYGAYYGDVTNVPVTLCGQTVYNTGSGGFATAALAVADNGATGSTTYNIAPSTTFKQVATVKSDANGTLGVINFLQVLAPTAILTTCSNNTRATRTGTEQLYLKDPLTGGCTGSAIPKMRTGTNSSTFNPEWVGLAPNTEYILIFTTTVDAQCTNYNKANVAYYGAVTPQFTFNCTVSSTTGTFVHGTGSSGTLTIGITGATAGAATFNVTGTGFTGTLSTTLTAGQTSVTIPITYDGIGAAGSQTLTVTSPSGGGTCSKAVTVSNPPLTASTPTAKTAIINQAKTGTASTELSPVGGNGTYTYSVDNSGSCTPPVLGALPLPLTSSLTVTNASTGAYTYTAPAAAGTYYYCIKVCDTSTPTPVCVTKTYTLTVSLPPCVAGTIAPIITATTVTNTCPTTTFSLGALANTGTKPAGTTLIWSTHKLPTSAGDTLTNLSTVSTAGKYYALYYDNVNNCYSPADSVTATINNCLDSDGDGITDINDLDDDNDGILDTDEGGCPANINLVTNGDFAAGSSNWTNSNVVFDGTNATFNLNIDNAASPDGSMSQSITGLSYNNLPVRLSFDFTRITSPASSSLRVSLGSTLLAVVFAPGSTYAPTVNTVTVSNGVTANVSTTTATTPNNLVLTIPYSAINANTATLTFDFVDCQGCANTANTDIVIDNVSVTIPCTILDTDGDGIANSLDLDSDGDGCPDAIEGGASFTTANLVASTMAGGNSGGSYTGTSSTPVTQNLGNIVGNTATTMGIPIIATTGQTVGYSETGAVNECTDSDNDGIADIYDLDDDNDGILDVVECNLQSLVVNGTFNTNLNGWTNASNTWIFHPAGFAGNQTDAAGTYVLSQSVPVTTGMFGTFSFDIAAVTRTNPVAGFFSVKLDGVTVFAEQNTDVIPTGVVNIPYLTVDNNLDIELVFRSVGGVTDDIYLDNISYIPNNCLADTDGDGIPNSLDLDSDGDGCPDAIEGGANFVTTLLVNSTMAGGNNGGSYTGTSSNPVTKNLGNTVGNTANTLGIPTIATTGQAVGNSENKLVQSTNCITCSAGILAPIITATTVTNTCPTTTFSLAALANTGIKPAGTTLIWSTHIVPTSAGDTLTNLTTLSTTGKYYAMYYDKVGGCYSPADSVTATLTICTVNPPSQTATVNQAKTGTASTDLTPTGGNGTYVYSVDNTGSCTPVIGALPLPLTSNLTVTNTSTGAYSYTAPAVAGTYYYCIKVCDTTTPTPNCTTKTYTLTVSPPVCAVGTAIPGLK